MSAYKVSFTDKTRAVEVEADGFRFAGGNQFIVFRIKSGKDRTKQVAAWPVDRVAEIRLAEKPSSRAKTS